MHKENRVQSHFVSKHQSLASTTSQNQALLTTQNAINTMQNSPTNALVFDNPLFKPGFKTKHSTKSSDPKMKLQLLRNKLKAADQMTTYQNTMISPALPDSSKVKESKSKPGLPSAATMLQQNISRTIEVNLNNGSKVVGKKNLIARHNSRESQDSLASEGIATFSKVNFYTTANSSAHSSTYTRSLSRPIGNPSKDANARRNLLASALAGSNGTLAGQISSQSGNQHQHLINTQLNVHPQIRPKSKLETTQRISEHSITECSHQIARKVEFSSKHNSKRGRDRTGTQSQLERLLQDKNEIQQKQTEQNAPTAEKLPIKCQNSDRKLKMAQMKQNRRSMNVRKSNRAIEQAAGVAGKIIDAKEGENQDRKFEFQLGAQINNLKVEMEQSQTQHLLNVKAKSKDTKALQKTAKNFQQQLKQQNALSNPKPRNPSRTASNQNSMLNTTVIGGLASRRSKQPAVKIQAKDKNATQTSIASNTKQPRNNIRAKSACRGKSDIFNSTTPIKFFSNLEESIRDSQQLRIHKNIEKAASPRQIQDCSGLCLSEPHIERVEVTNLISRNAIKAQNPDKQIADLMATSQNMVISGPKQKAPSGKHQKPDSRLTTTLHMNVNDDSTIQIEKDLSTTYTLLPGTKSENIVKPLQSSNAQTVSLVQAHLNNRASDKSSLQSSKIKLRLQSQKNRSSSSLSNERAIAENNLQTGTSASIGLIQADQGVTFTASQKEKIMVQDYVKVAESTKRLSSYKRITQASKERPSSSQGHKPLMQSTLQKKQIMRSLLQTQNDKGQSVPGSKSKRKSQSRAAYQSVPKAAKGVSNFNYGIPAQSNSRECLTSMQIRPQANNYQTQDSSQNASKSSSSLQQLPVSSKQKLANSVLLFNSTAKTNQFARVDLDRINTGNALIMPGQEFNYEDMQSRYKHIPNGDKGPRISDKKLAHTGKSLNSSNRINLPRPNTKFEKLDHFGTQIGKFTASGPLNPFLEQILKELPSANMQSDANNSISLANNIGTFNDGLNSIKSGNQPRKSGSTLSKKIRSNIEKAQNAKKSAQQQILLNTFNLTTTAAALIAASNKNATQDTTIHLATRQSVDNNQVKTITQPNIHSSKRTSQTSIGSVKNQAEMPVKDKIAEKEKTNFVTNPASGAESKQTLIRAEAEYQYDSEELPHRNQKESAKEINNLQNYFSAQNKFSVAKLMATKPSNSIKRFRVNVTKNQPTKSLERSANLIKEVENSAVVGSQAKIGLNNTMLGTMKVATQSLINVVKVAERQKKTALIKKDLTVQTADDPLPTLSKKVTKQQFSLNNTQIVADHLATFKQEQSTYNHMTLSNTAMSNLKHKLAQAQSSAQQSDQKPTNSLQQTQKLSFTQPRNSKQSRSKPKSMKHGRKLSNGSQFDWSGFLANLLQENHQPKKSTLGDRGNQGSALCAKPYQIQSGIQNKTQPLPKHLFERKSVGGKGDEAAAAGTKGNKFAAYGNNNYGMVYQKTESRGEYRPRIANKQIEIAPAYGSSTKLAATLQANQLKINGLNLDQEQPVAVLTEVTESEKEKDNSSSAPSTHRSKAQVNEDYKFGRMLGEGAYAVVRLAYKRSEGQSYAAKIYDKSKLVDEHRRSSVCREVMLMQKLKHQYCIEFVEAFETDHYVYVIMEYVRGRSLHDYLKKQKAEEGKTEYDQTLEESEAKRILRQLLEVLSYLHEEGITHRDIKLENILLDDNNNIKLIDFGFSTCYKPQKKIKMFCGTPSYMAPEIVSRLEYFGPPADIWAAGVLLFCLLNGFFPFKGQTDAELYRRIQRGSYKLMRDDLSDECINILKEFINVNQDSRLTAAELLQDNWFLSDSSKKRSHAEIRRQFKDKILSKIPLRSAKKEQICIPAPAKQLDSLTNQKYETSELMHDSNLQPTNFNRTQQNLQLALHRQLNEASPPSSMPSSSASYHPIRDVPRDFRQDFPSYLHQPTNNWRAQRSGTSDDMMNQQVTQAYFNTNGRSHNTVQGIAPPSGINKFTPTYIPDETQRLSDLLPMSKAVKEMSDEESKEDAKSVYSDSMTYQQRSVGDSRHRLERQQQAEDTDYLLFIQRHKGELREIAPRVKMQNFVEEQKHSPTSSGENENAARVAYGAISVPSNKQ